MNPKMMTLLHKFSDGREVWEMGGEILERRFQSWGFMAEEMTVNLADGSAYVELEQLRTEAFNREREKQMNLAAENRAQEALQGCVVFSRDRYAESFSATEIEDAVDEEDGDGLFVVWGFKRTKPKIKGDSILEDFLHGELVENCNPEEGTEQFPDVVLSAADELARALREEWEPWACEEAAAFLVRVEDVGFELLDTATPAAFDGKDAHPWRIDWFDAKRREAS